LHKSKHKLRQVTTGITGRSHKTGFTEAESCLTPITEQQTHEQRIADWTTAGRVCETYTSRKTALR